MYCIKCGNKLNNNDLFCTKCGNKKDTNFMMKNNFFGTIKKLFIALSILFSIIVFIRMFFLLTFYNEPHALIILLDILFTSPLVLPLIALAITIICFILSKKNINTKKSQNIFFLCMSFFYVAFTIFSIIFYQVINQFLKVKFNYALEQYIDKKFGNSYEILDTSLSDNVTRWLIKLPDFEYPIQAEYNSQKSSYNDNYDELNSVKQLNYQKYIDDVFDDNTVALMDLDYEYKYLNLKIFISKDKLENKDLLKDNFEKIINEYRDKFQDYHFCLYVYFIDEIDISKKDEYYSFLINESDKILDKIVEKSKLKKLSITIYEEDDDFTISEKLLNEIKRLNKSGNV